MNANRAWALRVKLEHDVLQLLQAYRDATGLTPVSVSVATDEVRQVGDGSPSQRALLGVKIEVVL